LGIVTKISYIEPDDRWYKRALLTVRVEASFW